MENHPFLAHFPLRVTYLEVVAAGTAPAGILVTKGIHLSTFHSHQWDIFSCFSNAAPSDKQLIDCVMMLWKIQPCSVSHAHSRSPQVKEIPRKLSGISSADPS